MIKMKSPGEFGFFEILYRILSMIEMKRENPSEVKVPL